MREEAEYRESQDRLRQEMDSNRLIHISQVFP
jgi:hypothetical protein